MLSLKTLTENSASLRTPEPALRLRDADESRQSDFQSYLAAALQQTPVQRESVNPAATPTERTAAPQAENSPEVMAAQKAGHDAAPPKSNADTTQQSEKTGKEVIEAKISTATITRNDRELLEALGLIRNRGEATKTASGILRGAFDAMEVKKSSHFAAKPLFVKGQTPTHTLTLLEKAPDLVLMSQDGLKKLGEKLGLSLLNKVGEKLNEKSRAQETMHATARSENKIEVLPATPARVQKAGERETEKQPETQVKEQRISARNVSRETKMAPQENAPTQNAAKSEQLFNTANSEPAATRNSVIVSQGEFRSYDAANAARQAENTRSAVENPMLRPELVRQFNEIITRAQVLINDTQNAQFSVKLFPREIGRMEIDLKLIDGEIRGKIVVESEEVKSEMQNFLQNSNGNSGAEKYDLNKIDIEVRNGNRNAQNPQKTPDTDELLQNLVTRTATAVYNAVETPTNQGNALYA